MRRVLPLILLVILAVPVVAQLRSPGPDNSLKVGEMAPDFPIPASRVSAAPGHEPCAADQRKERFDHVFPGCFYSWLYNGVHAGRYPLRQVHRTGYRTGGHLARLTWSLGEFKTKVGAKNLFVSDLEYTIIPNYGAANPNRGMLRYYYLVDKTGKIVWKDTSGSVLDTEKLVADLGAVVKK